MFVIVDFNGTFLFCSSRNPVLIWEVSETSFYSYCENSEN